MNNKNNKITDVFTKLTPAEFVEKYNSQQLQVKGGALCFGDIGLADHTIISTELLRLVLI